MTLPKVGLLDEDFPLLKNSTWGDRNKKEKKATEFNEKYFEEIISNLEQASNDIVTLKEISVRKYKALANNQKANPEFIQKAAKETFDNLNKQMVDFRNKWASLQGEADKVKLTLTDMIAVSKDIKNNSHHETVISEAGVLAIKKIGELYKHLKEKIPQLELWHSELEISVEQIEHRKTEVETHLSYIQAIAERSKGWFSWS